MHTATDVFAGDALNRVNFATNLTNLIVDLKSGVIAIDGEWGSGKSWFGQRVSGLLDKSHNVKTIWLDTFSADWHDDPALSLLAEFAEQLPSDKRQKFIEGAAPIAAKLAIAGGKAGLQAIGKWVGVDEQTTEQVVEAVQGTSEAYIKKRLKELAERKKSLASMKELMQGAVTESNGKIVVFVDELDRCSPPYAIRFLERIKHLFDVDGVVFVLLWNRQQIQHAVKAFYGQHTDGQMYLDRFVDYPLQLPNHHLDGRVEAMGLIVEAEIQRLSGQKQVLLHEASKLIGYFADSLALTAREVKHVCSWWVLSNLKNYEVLELWLLCLKVKRPDVYNGLRTESVAAHGIAESLMIAAQKSPVFDSITVALIRFHYACKSKDATNLGKELHNLFGHNLPAVLTICSQTILRIESVKQ